MIQVLLFKPRVANNRTAFEAMSLIYKYLEQNYKYNFTIVTANSDTYQDEQFRVVSIPLSGIKSKLWGATQYINYFPISKMLPPEVNTCFKTADVVITVDPTSRAAGIVGIKKAVATNTPVWFDTGRTTTRPFPGVWFKKRRAIFSEAVRNTTGIIATSPKVFEYFGDIGLFDQEIAGKFTVMGHPTDMTKFTPGKMSDDDSQPGIEVLTIARLVPEKGLYYVLESLDPILRKHNDVQLSIIGDGSMKSLLNREIRDRGLADSVNLKGTVPHNQIPDQLRSADIFINHSVDVAGWEEFFGAANIEAMACGLPCVLSDSGSIPYVARASEGVELVPQRDVLRLRESIQGLIDNPSQRRAMGQSARAFVEQEYSVEAISEKYHRMLQQGLE